MTDVPKLSKREWNALGTLLLPPQFGRLGPKTGPKLESMGLVEKTIVKLPPAPGDPAWAIVHVSGYQLTHRGRLLYCEWASTQVDEEC